MHPDANVGIAAGADGDGREGDVGGAGGALDAARGQDVWVGLVRRLVDDELGQVRGGLDGEGLAL